MKLAPYVVCVEPEYFVCRGEKVHDISMFDHHAFWLSRRARGENDVGQTSLIVAGLPLNEGAWHGNSGSDVDDGQVFKVCSGRSVGDDDVHGA
ncbi:hypothetical protein D3C81_2169370 [compost metagenome]